MQLTITIAIIAVCALLVLRAAARALFPALAKGRRESSCGCSGGCPALRQAQPPTQAPQAPAVSPPGAGTRAPAA